MWTYLYAFAAKSALGKVKLRYTLFIIPDNGIILAYLKTLLTPQAKIHHRRIGRRLVYGKGEVSGHDGDSDPRPEPGCH